MVPSPLPCTPNLLRYPSLRDQPRLIHPSDLQPRPAGTAVHTLDGLSAFLAGVSQPRCGFKRSLGRLWPPHGDISWPPPSRGHYTWLLAFLRLL